MKIEFLGTGGYFANSRRQTACLLLPEWGIVFDAGSGIHRLTNRYHGRDVQLFLTHAHLDHVIGLPILLMPLLSGQYDSISVSGGAATLEAVSTHLFEQRLFPVPVPFKTNPIELPGQIEAAPGLTIRWQALPSHPGGSIAYRVDLKTPNENCSFAYVTDTTMDGSYEELIQGVDLLIHECYFDDARAHLATKTGHCFAREVAELAVRTHVGRMILVHVDPTVDLDDPVGLPGMQAIFPHIELAVDGMMTDVVRP